MSTVKMTGTLDIAGSGLRAQARRMRVIANNIANVKTSRAKDGKPFSRQFLAMSADPSGGVQVDGVLSDLVSEHEVVHMPGHPDADSKGYVTMSNVQIPVEMMEMTLASRIYQANAAILKRYQDGVDVTLELLR